MPQPARKTKRSKSPHRGSVASRVRQRVERGGERLWRLQDFPGLSPGAVAKTLSRLAQEGTLERARKGVYYRARESSFGRTAPTASAVAAQTLRVPVHPAGLTAANVLRLTTQNPARLEYATSASDPPTALMGAYVYARRPPAHDKLTAEEGALLELLRDRARTSDLSATETAARLRRLLADPGTFARLARAALTEPPRVRAMLGALGQQLGADPKLLQQLRNSLNPLSRFDFGLLRDLPHAREWQAR